MLPAIMMRTKHNPKCYAQPPALLDAELDELLNAAKPVDELPAELQGEKERQNADPELALGLLKAEIVADFLRVMEEEGLNKNQLARRLGKSRQYVGRVLNETANFALESLVEMACALNRRILLRAARPGERWALSEPASLVEIPKAWERSDADYGGAQGISGIGDGGEGLSE